MTAPLEIIATYIRAKDGNRPLLIRQAFAKDFELEMNVKTDAISFPNSAKGLEAITDVLVCRFAANFENIFTFCLSQPSATDRRHSMPLVGRDVSEGRWCSSSRLWEL